jgi:coproporphyrinogen III oxidase-like Fe-S oxidoreductase
MLGLRLDEPVDLDALAAAIDPAELGRLERLGIVEVQGRGLVLTDRGRFLGDAATVALLA